MATDIVCLGELLIDMFPGELGRSLVEVSAWYPKPGGAPANVAVAAARLGARSAFIGKVSDDLFGHYLAQVLAENDVQTQGMRFDTAARTTLAFHAKPDPNTAEYLFYRNPGADMLLRADELDHELLAATRAFHFGSITLIQEPSRSATLAALALAHTAGALISFDVNYRPSLWGSADQARSSMLETIPQAHLLKVNETELELLTGDRDIERASSKLLALGPELVVVTLGPQGSYFFLGGAGEAVAGYSVLTVDAVGCGDAFIAGLLTRLIQHDNWRSALNAGELRAALRYANAVGALTATRQGVIPALPRTFEVERFMAAA